MRKKLAGHFSPLYLLSCIYFVIQHVNSTQSETLEGAFYIKAIDVKYLDYNPRWHNVKFKSHLALLQVVWVRGGGEGTGGWSSKGMGVGELDTVSWGISGAAPASAAMCPIILIL